MYKQIMSLGYLWSDSLPASFIVQCDHDYKYPTITQRAGCWWFVLTGISVLIANNSQTYQRAMHMAPNVSSVSRNDGPRYVVLMINNNWLYLWMPTAPAWNICLGCNHYIYYRGREWVGELKGEISKYLNMKNQGEILKIHQTFSHWWSIYWTVACTEINSFTLRSSCPSL
jgi:hypothetical protein